MSYLRYERKNSQRPMLDNLDDLMLAYLNDARCWLQLKRDSWYVSWQDMTILFNPENNWMHECIWDWTRKWDQALMMSKVWPLWPPRWTGIAYV